MQGVLHLSRLKFDKSNFSVTPPWLEPKYRKFLRSFFPKSDPHFPHTAQTNL